MHTGFDQRRRDLLRWGAAFAAATGVPAGPAAAIEPLAKRAIPRSGETIPVVGVGTWRVFDIAGDRAALAQGREALALFHRLGGRVIDSSPMYGSAESVIGELTTSLGIREEIFVATKVWTSGREAGVRQMEASIAKLGGRRVDLMQVHNLVDADTHLATLAAWKREGRIRYLGVTHYHEGAYDAVERYVKQGALDFLQINYSLGEREAAERLLPLAAETGTAVLVNRPFGEGGLFGRVRGKPLPPWAADIGVASWAQFFLKWILGHPAVTCAIPGTRNPKYVEDNLGAGRGTFPDAAMRQRMVRYFDAL